MNEPHLTYPLAKPADRYVKLIHGSVDIKVIDAVFDPTHCITAHPEPLEHVGGQGYRFDLVGMYVRHLAGDPVGMGVDPIYEVVRYVKWQHATGSLFDDDTATSCMSYYGLCE